jgi:hypothetical protein
VERKPRSEHHSRRLRQPTPEATSCASETPSTHRPLCTMRPPTRTNGAMATPRPQPRPHRIPRLLTRRAVPRLRRTVQPQSSSEESTSHTALRQPTQPHLLRRTPLVSRGFLGRAGELTGNPSSSEPTRFRLPLRVLLVGSEVDRHLSADLSTSEKAKLILEVSHAIGFLL